MGRQPWADRWVVERCLSLDISTLKAHLRQESGIGRVYRWFDTDGRETASIRYRVLAGSGLQPALMLRYTLTENRKGTKIPLEYAVQTTTSPCNFGRPRSWLICPVVRDGVPCLKRVRKLYLPPEGRFFGCRTCYRLVYTSAREHDRRLDRYLRLSVEEFERVLVSGNAAERIGNAHLKRK
jgi:hypothetical protein